MKISDIKMITEAYNKIPHKLLLNKLTFEHSLLYHMDLPTIKDGWIYPSELGGMYFGAVNIEEPSRTSEDLIRRAVVSPEEFEFDSVITLDTNESMVKSTRGRKTGFYDFIYDNRKEAIELTGKKFTQFRVAKRYLEDPDITYEVVDKLSASLYSELIAVIDRWCEYEDSKGLKVYGDTRKSVKNFDLYGDKLDAIIIIVRHKGEILSYMMSERLNPHYVIMADGKFNFKTEKEIERKYQYVTHLVHWLTLKYWDDLLKSDYLPYLYNYETDGCIYYNLGNSDEDSFKNRLRPSIKQAETTHYLSKLNRLYTGESVFGGEILVSRLEDNSFVVYAGETLHTDIVFPDSSKMKDSYFKVIHNAIMAIKPNEVMIFGLGGGLQHGLLNRELPSANVHSLEIEPAMIDIAKSFYDVKRENVTLCDVSEHVYELTDSKYDVIVHDIFSIVNESVPDYPESINNMEYWIKLSNLVSEKGYLILNYIDTCSDLSIKVLSDNFANHMKIKTVDDNYIIIFSDEKLDRSTLTEVKLKNTLF